MIPWWDKNTIYIQRIAAPSSCFVSLPVEDCTKPTQNTEATAPSQTEDEPIEAPIWHTAPPLGLLESSIQDVDCEEEQLPMKEEARGEAKELSDSQGEMTAQIDTQQVHTHQTFTLLLCFCFGSGYLQNRLGRGGQQPKQGSPEFPFPSHSVQLFWGG